MNSNTFESIIKSFESICSTLEKNAELRLKEVEKECEEEFASSVKSLQKFDEIISAISETCSEVVNNYDIMKVVTKNCTNENAINLPYEIHYDLVNCINKLYNMPALRIGANEEKLINERNQQLVKNLIQIGEKSVLEVRDMDNTITESKEMF